MNVNKVEIKINGKTRVEVRVGENGHLNLDCNIYDADELLVQVHETLNLLKLLLNARRRFEYYTNKLNEE